MGGAGRKESNRGKLKLETSSKPLVLRSHFLGGNGEGVIKGLGRQAEQSNGLLGRKHPGYLL